MADATGSALCKCDEELPLLGVTREFDFGQFIELFDATPDPKHPDDPTVARIVIQPSASLAADRMAPLAGGPNKTSAPAAVASRATRPPNRDEVDVFDLTDHGPAAKLAAAHVEIADGATFFRTGKVDVDGRTVQVRVDEAMEEALATGLTVTTFAEPADGANGGGTVPVSLALPFERVELSQSALAAVLAGQAVSTGIGECTPVLDAPAIRALLDGRIVLTHGVAGAGKMPIELRPPGGSVNGVEGRFQIFDLPAFVAEPAVLTTTGSRMPLDLRTENVQQLLAVGHTRVDRSGHPVDLEIVRDDPQVPESKEFHGVVEELKYLGNGTALPPAKAMGSSWQDIITAVKHKPELSVYFMNPHKLDHGLYSGVAGTGTAVGTGTTQKATGLTDKVQSRLPSGTGLPVAVFVPWRQTWTLDGFSRGNLLHSIALAPLEQVTMQVFSWERRTRSLEQSSETEAEQATETSQTTRDTEDVFREMTAKHDFAWQLSGSLDASYSNGVASISVGVDGSVSDTTSIEQTARNSSQSVRESTVKASARVRSRRVTRVTQSVETGREDRVTRVIQNPNQCHTLTLDFFEALAHYTIRLEFVKARMRLVVLVPNPISFADFTSEIVRRNETTLRNALIEPALADGFEAVRLVAAYGEAGRLLTAQQSDAAKLDELRAQRDKAAPLNAPDPAGPQQAEVERIATEMIAAINRIRGALDIDTAMVAIRDHARVSEAARVSGQHWLFVNYCAAKFPALLATLDELSGGSVAALAAAQKINSVLPRPDAPTNLANLNQMSDKEKEDAGIASKIRESAYLGGGPFWAWWSGRLREEGLYSANDEGLGGMADQLVKALQAWEAKKAQGAAMKDQETAKTEAEGRQDKASTDDKLSMAFPLDELAHAYERRKVLCDHLNEHREFYNYALFQALPPSEQALRIVEASNGKLQVGLFEPRVVAMNGSRLAVPLTPLAGSQSLRDFVADLAKTLKTAFDEGLAQSDSAILPTPGVTVSTRLGKCTGCEEYLETARGYELDRLKALAQQEVWEATRREKRIEVQKNYDEFAPRAAAVKLEIEGTSP